MLFTIGYTEAAVRRRVKLMALANICAEKQRLSYAEIASELAIEESEVESWVINGMLPFSARPDLTMRSHPRRSG